MVIPSLRHIELPHLDEQRWQKLKDLYSELDGIETAKDLAEVLERLFTEAGNDIKLVSRSTEVLDSNVLGSSWYFDGLGIFLEEIATEEERETFFNIILPFIVTLASSIEEFAPSECILLCSQQRESGVVLDRRFIACILASAFLCALPPPPVGTQVRSINFVSLFSCFHREEIQQTQAAKLRCLIHYFERLQNDWPDIGGKVFYSRQVIPRTSLPTLEDWASCDLPLCPVIVDSKTAIEDSGEHMLQVDFANHFIGGGVLGAGHVQEEIRFCINPELLVTQMFMEALQDNECIVVRGVERFSSYAGYGKTFEFTGDFKDKSQRDKEGDFHTTIVAIDATKFKTVHREAQYEETALVRELNKGLVGFYNPEVGSDIINSPSGVESDESSVESDDHLVSYEETETTMDETPPPTPEIAKLQEFSDDFVKVALTQALNEVDSNNNLTSKDVEDGGDILTVVMKKSLTEVFGSTPDKARVYSENLLSPTPLPKCVSRTISGSNTPVVPGTPPSSPAVYSLVQTSLDSFGFQTSLTSSSSLSVRSFADSLSNSLMSRVELTSSLATAIATAADSPVLTAAGTKASFQKSPRNIKSPVKNGDKLISFLSQKVSESESPLSKKYYNIFHFKEFVEDLTSLVSSSKKESYNSGADSRVKFPSARQNLLGEFDQVKFEGRGKDEPKNIKGFDMSNAKLFESFASELSRSIINSAINSSLCSQASSDETKMDAVINKEIEYITADSPGDSQDDYQRAVDLGMKDHDLRIVLEDHMDALLVKTMSTALAEATGVSDGKTDDEEEEKSGESDRATQSEEEENNESVIQLNSESGENDASSPESTEEEQSDVNEGTTSGDTLSELSSVILEAAARTAEKLAEKILNDGLSRALEVSQETLIETVNANESYTQEETQLEVDESATEESSFSDEEISEEQTLQSFADRFSSLTVRGAVEIAEACLESPSLEPRVRPVATGNWGCGVFRGDPELKAVIQWVAASAAGCPVVVYHTFGDKRMSQLLKTLVCLQSRGWKVSDVIQGVLRFRDSARDGRDGTIGHRKLLSFLCRTPQTSL